MKLYTYILKNDGGFAPNPFHGCCTLATCKPRIRRAARPGDWVAGIGAKGKRMGGLLLYAMRVDEVLPVEQYGVDPRFEIKRPATGLGPQRRNGDNAYYRDDAGAWRRRDNVHSAEDMAKDLGGRNVLVSRHFYYFGEKAVPVPEQLLRTIRPARYDRCKFSDEVVQAFVAWVTGLAEPGRHGDPAEFDARPDDGSAVVPLTVRGKLR